MKKLLFVFVFLVISKLQVFAPVSIFTAEVKEITKDCKIFKLDAKQVTALFLSEDMQLKNITHYEPRLKDYSYGPGEILFKTAWDMGFTGTRTQLKNYKTNIYYTVKFIAFMLKFYGSDWIKTVQYYKTGNPNGRLYYERFKEIYQKLIL